MEEWRNELRNSIKTIMDLKKRIKFLKEEKLLSKVVQASPFQITHYYANLINWDDPDDPLKKIVVPTIEETSEIGTLDPGNEKENIIIPKF